MTIERRSRLAARPPAGRRVQALVLTAMLAWGGAALAEDPLTVRLDVPKRLELGKRGYRGRIKVTITNRSSRAITAHHGEENYLVFEGDDGKLDVICHSCACLQNSPESRAPAGPFAVTLPPGGKKELAFEDWGCSGSAWRGPPAGTYQVTYRVFLDRQRHPSEPRACCEALRRAAFWTTAISSPPVKLSIVGKRPK